MYAVISCIGCKKLRIIDKSSLTSECPFCGVGCEHRYIKTIFEDKDQTAVRDALAHYSGFTPEKEDKTSIELADPHSTLVYRYEHCSDMTLKMEILCKGLTDIFGIFTIDDVESVDPKNATRLIGAMQEMCLIAEIRPGKYRAI